jgi:beta-N-acetylhexosaminidase
LVVKAGVDIITIGNNLLFGANTTARAISIITEMVTNGTIPPERIDESYNRIMTLKGYFPTT